MSLNIKLLESSMELIKPQAIEFANKFYDNLFRDYPEVEPLFAKNDREAMQKKLLVSLVLIVENIRNMETLQSALKSLGARHYEVGTLEKHYPMVGDALLKTFKSFLGEKWTAEMEESWLAAYNEISNMMLTGTEKPEAYLGGELTFYDWLDLYGEYDPDLMKIISSLTDFQYGYKKKGEDKNE